SQRSPRRAMDDEQDGRSPSCSDIIAEADRDPRRRQRRSWHRLDARASVRGARRCMELLPPAVRRARIYRDSGCALAAAARAGVDADVDVATRRRARVTDRRDEPRVDAVLHEQVAHALRALLAELDARFFVALDEAVTFDG